MIHDEERLIKGFWAQREIYTGWIRHLLNRGSVEGSGEFYGWSIAGFVWRQSIDVTGWSSQEIGAYIVLEGRAHRAIFDVLKSDSDIWAHFPDHDDPFGAYQPGQMPLFGDRASRILELEGLDPVVIFLTGEPTRLAN